MTTSVEQIDPVSAPDETLRALHELLVLSDYEDLPEDEPIPLEQRFADWRNPKDHRKTLSWASFDGETAAAQSVARMDREQNLRNGFGWVFVHPDHRGQGLAREVARPMLDALEADGRDRFATVIRDGAPTEVIAKRGGLKLAYREKRSRLELADLDWDLMDRWITRASERAGDYELICVGHPAPEEMVERYADLYDIMNTAPREDMEEEDEIVTPEMLRDIEAKEVMKERRWMSYVAVHRPSDSWAGFTEVVQQSLQPHLAYQWNTGVHPDHQNHGLGRWLKAQMIWSLLEEYPDIRQIDTWNAGSNEPMLAINDAMGFKLILTENVWQGDLAAMRKRLDV